MSETATGYFQVELKIWFMCPLWDINSKYKAKAIDLRPEPEGIVQLVWLSNSSIFFQGKGPPSLKQKTLSAGKFVFDFSVWYIALTDTRLCLEFFLVGFSLLFRCILIIRFFFFNLKMRRKYRQTNNNMKVYLNVRCIKKSK